MRQRFGDPLKHIPEALRFVLPIWLAARLLTILFAAWIWKLRPQPPQPVITFYRGLEPIVDGWRGMFFGIWQRWDTIYYQIIVEQGYVTERTSVFFPLYPLTAKFLSRLTGLGSLESLFVVSTLAYLAVLWLLYILTEEFFGTTIARRAVAALALLPSSFFFLALYPQGLGLALTLLAVWLARRRRWAGCALAAVLSGLTHSIGLSLSAILLAEAVIFIRNNTHPWRWVTLCVAGMPALGIGLFWAWRIYQGFPSLVDVQINYFERVNTTLWRSLFIWINMLPHHLLSPDWIMNGVALFLTIASMIWAFRKISISWAAYLAILLFVTLGIVVDKDPLLSYNRYVLAGFPIFAMLGCWLNSPLKRLLGFALGIISQTMLLMLFLLWAWVG